MTDKNHIEGQPQFRLKQIVLLIIFAILFGFTVSDGIRIVVQKIYQLPGDAFSFGYWGDAFWTRIIASAFGSLAGGFVIGTYLGKVGKIPSILHTSPAVLLWLVAFVIEIADIKQYGFPILALILIITNPVFAFIGWNWGNEYSSEFENGNKILNIKWYHWIWILPFYSNKVVSIPAFLIILLLKLDLAYDNAIQSPIITLITSPGYIVSRILILIFLAIIIGSINHNYKMLSEENGVTRWKRGIIIFGHTIFLILIYVFVFGLSQLNYQ
jgi:hypothetical protein